MVLAHLQWEMLKDLPIPDKREHGFDTVGRAEEAGAVDWDEGEGDACHPSVKLLTETSHNSSIFPVMVSLGFWFAI